MTWEECVGLQAGAYTQGRNEEEDGCQEYGQLEKGLLHTAAGTDDGARPCPESSFSPRLGEDDEDQGQRDYDLDDAEIVYKLHVLSAFAQRGR